jgi:hypothetical protein
MKPILSSRAGLVFAMALSVCLVATSQTKPPNSTPPTVSAPVLVDVIPDATKPGVDPKALLTGLKREDFRLLDNGKEVPITGFKMGATRGTRPISLWFIVQCPEALPPDWHSEFMRGKTQLLKPALANLDKQDVVGVAHWCDDGAASIDFTPAHDPDGALAAVEHVLGEKAFDFRSVDNRQGELAMQKMFQLIVDDAQRTKPSRLPALLFLYGDHCGLYEHEAQRILQQLLETSGIVFGISDGGVHFNPDMLFANHQINFVIHYYGKETGGEYYTATSASLFPAALEFILTQLHFRYTLAFEPPVVDGKRHTLKVEFTKDARARFPGVDLRFRQTYVPVAVTSQP